MFSTGPNTLGEAQLLHSHTLEVNELTWSFIELSCKGWATSFFWEIFQVSGNTEMGRRQSYLDYLRGTRHSEGILHCFLLYNLYNNPRG